jgi:phage terminase large subunit
MDDSTAIWFSQSSPSGEVRLIGYYENSGHGLHHYVGVLKEKQAQFGWTFGDHYLPHDVDVKELGTGVSRLETLRSMGLFSVVTIKRTESLYDDINAVRMLLPRCYFNVPACEPGVEALMHYRWKEGTEHQTGRTLPVHDWASHGADALRTLACAPVRKAKLLSAWNTANKDRDPDDARWGKGKAAVRTGRGGW